MKKVVIFFFIFLFSAMFVASLMQGMAGSPYREALGIAGQAGMALGLIVFFLTARTGKSGKEN